MRIHKLDGLRGFCSLMVVFYHYPQSFLPDFIFGNFFIRESWSFVDFFFVLSGFVISYNYTTLSSSNDFWLYIKKRIIRLYPLLFFTSIIFLFFKVFSDNFFPELVGSPKSIKLYVLDTCNTLLLLNSTPVFGEISKYLGMNHPSWSVSAEFISYALFGFSSLFYFNKKNLFSFVTICLCVVVYLLKQQLTISNYTWFFLRGLIGFNVGCLVFWLFAKKLSIKNNLELVLPLLIVFVSYFFYSYEFSFKGVVNFIFRPLFFGFIILVLLKTNHYFSRFLESKPLIFLGKISYSIYLNHILLLLVFPRIAFRFFGLPQSYLTELLVLLITMLFVILYSSFTYKYIELALGKSLKKWFKANHE
ncbi:acyltransferase [Flavobacteriales bacterium]|nr:acyltransferase [Flavobacteriales bacterium]